MASLTEVYEGGNGAGLRRLYAGVALFGVGAVLLVAGIVIAATGVGSRFGFDMFEARRVAGILGGLGLPAVLLGTMTVLPRSSRKVRVAAFAGAAVSAAGVVLFNGAYPVDWVGGSGDTSMTLVVAAVYFFGTLVTSWCLFAAVANFKARNDPGGTVKLEITKEGETKVVEVSNDRLKGTLGGIGLLGGTPDGNVETQTNHASESGGSTAHDDGATVNHANKTTSQSRNDGFGGASAGVTDGGSTTTDSVGTPPSTDDAEFLDDESSAPVGDTYCGNCKHFRYVRTDDGMVPYCGLHSEQMDDMDACEQWTPNTNS
ncbi:hypothetical protein KY092_17250 [Natronomonas gomsonensis]|uniref:DUF7139 domain-containing protein n=1 Tax=Natronomonas gomsonensis TaxID=1046043 RepID=UPI0020CA6D5C|nr:hypothetical protein [Natronomonas gomsonensis]MCY4732302.1 hypothetical protein [Natronomonas gomsonensis]